LTTTDVAIWLIVTGALATLAHDYTYGQNVHQDILPHVFRQMDPTYAPRDFVVNASMEHQPRLYYSKAIAALGLLFPLSAVFFALAIFCNVLLALVTWLAARRFYPRSLLTPFLACSFVLVLKSFTLGDACGLVFPEVVPAQLAIPVALLGLLLALEGRPAACAILCALASLAHPQVGLEIGELAIAAYTLTLLIRRLGARGNGHSEPAVLRRIAWACAWAIALALFGYFFWLRPMPQELDTATFILIYARFRMPHHLWPSGFWPRYYFAALAFFAAAFLCWRDWRSSPGVRPSLSSGALFVVGQILALSFGAWFFVEIVPTRLFVSLQPFRLLLVVKWIGFILLAGTVAQLWRGTPDPRRPFLGWFLAMGSGVVQPYVMLLARLAIAVEQRLTAHPNLANFALGAATIVISVLLMGWGSYKESLTLLSFLCFAFFLLVTPGKRLRRGLPLVALLMLAGLLAVDRHTTIPLVSRVLGRVRPVLTLEDGKSDGLAVANFARENTPNDALFLSPPGFGGFRIVARRSLVVAFMSIPHQDWAMREYYERMNFCYGQSRGFLDIPLLEERYRTISTEHIRRVGERYGATHAILHAETETDLPIIYQDESYRIVRIPHANDGLL
jgi:hypothetical protein